jgi:hypothetical protein
MRIRWRLIRIRYRRLKIERLQIKKLIKGGLIYVTERFIE